MWGLLQHHTYGIKSIYMALSAYGPPFCDPRSGPRTSPRSSHDGPLLDQLKSAEIHNCQLMVLQLLFPVTQAACSRRCGESPSLACVAACRHERPRDQRTDAALRLGHSRIHGGHAGFARAQHLARHALQCSRRADRAGRFAWQLEGALLHCSEKYPFPAEADCLLFVTGELVRRAGDD